MVAGLGTLGPRELLKPEEGNADDGKTKSNFHDFSFLAWLVFACVFSGLKEVGMLPRRKSVSARFRGGRVKRRSRRRSSPVNFLIPAEDASKRRVTLIENVFTESALAASRAKCARETTRARPPRRVSFKYQGYDPPPPCFGEGSRAGPSSNHYVPTSSAVFWMISQTLRRCCSVVRMLPRPMRITVRPRNFVCVR